MPNRFLVPALITGMILTGACNSLWSKYQDMQCVENCDDPDPKHHVLYEQPVWQTLQMFLGEMLCFLPVLYTTLASRWRAASIHLSDESSEDTLEGLSESHKPPSEKLTGWRVLLLWLPALCDLTGTTLMNVGLLYTPVSIYQMTRGALVLFVGNSFSAFLAPQAIPLPVRPVSVSRHLFINVRFRWLSLLTVMAGVSLVGFSGSLIKDTLSPIAPSLVHLLDSIPATATPADQPINQPEASKVVIGVFFILFAQIFTATQFVVEEKILGRYSVPPLLAVGYEGLFGTISVLVLLPLLPLINLPPSSPAAAWFDLVRGWHQLVDTPSVLHSGIVIACSIALFNYFGLSVTKTLAIWIVSLLLGWELLMWPISVLQVVGFGLLVYGTFLFNNLVQPPPFLRPSVAASAPTEAESEDAPLLSGDVLGETARLPANLSTGGSDFVPPKGQGAIRGRSGH
ncbi:hypothetical protein F5148DRAFT_1325480 [Russula earlei]|uniref:Uncharacterized protein n=1 Tax=Russula earlei TaxID=71964 RepID=A0ACC0UJE1_9AGAM|nr:hypothetical protein F5148DRAFT_1325480 [Russula earlei]